MIVCRRTPRTVAHRVCAPDRLSCCSGTTREAIGSHRVSPRGRRGLSTGRTRARHRGTCTQTVRGSSAAHCLPFGLSRGAPVRACTCMRVLGEGGVRLRCGNRCTNCGACVLARALQHVVRWERSVVTLTCRNSRMVALISGELTMSEASSCISRLRLMNHVGGCATHARNK